MVSYIYKYIYIYIYFKSSCNIYQIIKFIFKFFLNDQISGTLEASNDRSDYSQDGRHWLLFDSVQNLIVEGGGTINGNGKIWWQNSCKVNKALVSQYYRNH